MDASFFISAVSDEFSILRGNLAQALARVQRVHEQSSFVQAASETLQKLDDYVGRSDVVIHLVGARPGAFPPPEEFEAYLGAEPGFQRFLEKHGLAEQIRECSYTQWEAVLAFYRGKALLVYLDVSKGPLSEAQSRHLDWLTRARRYPSEFRSAEDLLLRLIGDIVNLLRGGMRREIHGVWFGAVGGLVVSLHAFTSGAPWGDLTALRDIHDWVGRARDGHTFRLPYEDELRAMLRSGAVNIVPHTLEVCLSRDGYTCALSDAESRAKRLNIAADYGDLRFSWRVVVESES